MASIPPDFPLPQVHAALTAFIANRSTTREKRQVLTCHIRNCAEKISTSKQLQDDEEAFKKYLDTQLGRQGSYVNRQWEKGRGAKGRFGFGKEDHPSVEVREPPPLVTGPRREYLIALRDNIIAKREYEEAIKSLQDEESDSGMSEADEDPNELDTAFLTTYNTTEHLKTTLNSLLYMRDYLTDLSTRLSESPPSLEVPRLNVSRPPSMPSTRASISTTSKIDQSSQLFPLRKAIHDTVSTIKHLESLPSPPPPQEGVSDELQALEKTRAKLQGWIEMTLPIYEDTDMAQTRTPQEIEDLENARAGIASKIQSSYEEYLDVRRRVVGLIDEFLALPPLPAPEDVAFTPSTNQQKERPSTPPRTTPSFPVLQPEKEADLLFPHLATLVNHLPTLISTHKSLLTSRTALTSTLSTDLSSFRSCITSLAISNDVPGVTPLNQSRYGGAEDEFIGKQDSLDVVGKWVDHSSRMSAERQRRIRETALEGKMVAERVEGLVRETRETVDMHQGGWGKLGGGVGVIGEI